jgi:hypothetical protein
MKTFRNISWIVFLISILAFGMLYPSRIGVSAPSHHSRTDPSLIVSFITATGSLISGLVTSIISLKKDRLDTQKTELELEKTKLEIAKLQKENK